MEVAVLDNELPLPHYDRRRHPAQKSLLAEMFSIRMSGKS